jgi:hypothetical protein
MQPLDTAELLARIARVREEVAAIEKLLLPFGTKAEARKLADVRDSLNDMEAQLTAKEAS